MVAQRGGCSTLTIVFADAMLGLVRIAAIEASCGTVE